MKILRDQSCPVFTGYGSLEKMRNFLHYTSQKQNAKFSRIVLVHESHAANLILPPLFKEIPQLKEVSRYELNSTESAKRIENLLPLWQAWSDDHIDRTTLIVLVGGGVLCDMGGFAASVFKRGIDFICIPTTLLAMADASVGGKTAVDLGEMKNLIGNFRRPVAVAIDPLFLSTLPQTEYLSGMAEILKMQLIGNRRFQPGKTMDAFDPLHFSEELLHFAVKRKVRITRLDFQEKNIRKTLNFGHTFGHAFEALALLQNRPVPHGYAVAHGMLCEMFLSMRYGKFPQRQFREAASLIRSVYGRFCYSEEDIPSLIEYMRNDKKNRSNEIQPVLLRKYGSCTYSQSISAQTIAEVLQGYPFDKII